MQVNSNGIRVAITEPSLNAFKDRIDTLYEHVVEKKQWLNPDTLEPIRRPNCWMHRIQNILKRIQHLFGQIFEHPASKINQGLSWYYEANQSFLIKAIEEANAEDETLKKAYILGCVFLRKGRHGYQAGFSHFIPAINTLVQINSSYHEKFNRDPNSTPPSFMQDLYARYGF